MVEGYEGYKLSLLTIPVEDFGEASSDDLSSDWDTEEVEIPICNKVRFWLFFFFYLVFS